MKIQSAAAAAHSKGAGGFRTRLGVLTPNRECGPKLVRREFRRFLQAILLVPCPVVHTARRGVFRVLGYNGWLKEFFATSERRQQPVLVG